MRRSVDTPFLLVICVLVVSGLLIFTSAALGLLARGGASFTSVATSQVLLGLVSGGIALVVLSHIDYRLWRTWTPYFFALALALTALTLTHFGISMKGASRWLALGPISFQPQEVLKFASIAFLAALYASRVRDIRTFRAGILPLILIAGAASLVLLLQPNTAGVVIICGSCAAMLFAAGGRISHILVLFMIGVVIVGALALERPYLRARFETFFNPGRDAQGSGYQVQQSLIAIGSGGFWGRGFGQSIEKFSYLPEPIGDSIFAVVGGLRIAARAPDTFGSLLVIGLVVLIAGQSFINIASAIGILPLSGEPLIFVSHGGTALAIALAEVGVILSVSRRMKQG